MENVTLSKTSLDWLFDAARWARFIAILGFILIGFLVIVGIFIGPVLSNLNKDLDIAQGAGAISSAVIAAIYLVIAAVYFFPIYYLFQFSNSIIKAFKTEDEEGLNASIRFLKMHYKFIGILLIITLVIYLLAFVVGMGAMIANFI